jgi:hypothetical protein
MWAPFLFFKKLFKENNHPFGEFSLNRVTLFKAA